MTLTKFLATWTRDALLELPEDKRIAVIRELSPEDALALKYHWPFWARPKQLPPPGKWRIWMMLAGRGWGKTRTGAEWIRSLVDSNSAQNIAIIGATAGDVRDVAIEGPAGLLQVFPPGKMPKYEPTNRRVKFHNGAWATTFSGEEPDRLRGWQGAAAWCDELASWAHDTETWSMLSFGIRVGDPRVCITTTPKPTALIRKLATAPKGTILTSGSTYENADNLPAEFIETIREQEGTRLGRQEIHAEILSALEGALWNRKMFIYATPDQVP